MVGQPIGDGYGGDITDGSGNDILDGYPAGAAALPFPARRLQRIIAAHFRHGHFHGRAPKRVAVGPRPPPPPPVYPFGKQRQLSTYAAHFARERFHGRRLPTRDFAYGGGAGLPARASQIVFETLYQATLGARASQIVLEALSGSNAQFRASQLVLENLVGVQAQVRASQIVIEVLVPTPELPVIPVYPVLAGLTYSVVKRPKLSTGAGVASSGKEVRVGYWAIPQWEWDLTYEVLNDNGVPNGTTASDIKTLIGFFLLAFGTQWPFYFLDPDDFEVTGQVLGTTDGVTSSYLFVRTYGLGDFSGTEPVGTVNTAQTLNIYLDGVLQNPDTYTINATTPCGSYVQFTTAPAGGLSLTADFQFYYYARFKDDSYDFEKIMESLWNQKKLTIFSLKS